MDRRRCVLTDGMRSGVEDASQGKDISPGRTAAGNRSLLECVLRRGLAPTFGKWSREFKRSGH
ncbi:MAG: hypothetical protein OXC26_05680 [Albidovulum sp.]|nr:hypothetical protein [Albidovulum sp.]